MLRLALGTYTHSGGQPHRKLLSREAITEAARVVALLAWSCSASFAGVMHVGSGSHQRSTYMQLTYGKARVHDVKHLD